VEVFCLEPAGGGPVEAAFAQRGEVFWHCTIGNAKRWKAGPLMQRFRAPAGEVMLVAERRSTDAHGHLVRLAWEPPALSFAEVLERAGHVPLPPYMKRPDVPADRERYNTVFARQKGSVAAPTASLHFTPGVLQGLKGKGIATTELTLHVGAGTFLPVKSAHMAGHAMHGEQVRIPRKALEDLLGQQGRGPVVAVGTTALRTLESLYWHGVMVLEDRAGDELSVGQWEPYDRDLAALPSAAEALQAALHQVEGLPGQRLVGRTELLIAPGCPIRLADALITNFHQPRSTLLLLVAAFIGPGWRRVYEHALRQGYRFLSYGDGSLLWRHHAP
jgi:S-adenosylmethionine:tRNA ribosyltransferase-isomerase